MSGGVVSFIVHLDELNPHAHAVIVPITKAETKIKALQTMVSNLEKAEAEKQATIAELEDYMKNHLGDAVEIKAKITATRKELWDVRDKLNDKKMKLEQAKLQLDKLQKNTYHIEARNREIKADFEKQLFHTSNR